MKASGWTATWSAAAAAVDLVEPVADHLPMLRAPARVRAGPPRLMAAMRDFRAHLRRVTPEFQRAAWERYWCLRWLRQHGRGRGRGHGAAREQWCASPIPLVIRVPSMPLQMPGSQVRARRRAHHLLDVEVRHASCRRSLNLILEIWWTEAASVSRDLRMTRLPPLSCLPAPCRGLGGACGAADRCWVAPSPSRQPALLLLIPSCQGPARATRGLEVVLVNRRRQYADKAECSRRLTSMPAATSNRRCAREHRCHCSPTARTANALVRPSAARPSQLREQKQVITRDKAPLLAAAPKKTRAAHADTRSRSADQRPSTCSTAPPRSPASRPRSTRDLSSPNVPRKVHRRARRNTASRSASRTGGGRSSASALNLPGCGARPALRQPAAVG